MGRLSFRLVSNIVCLYSICSMAEPQSFQLSHETHINRVRTSISLDNFTVKEKEECNYRQNRTSRTWPPPLIYLTASFNDQSKHIPFIYFLVNMLVQSKVDLFVTGSSKTATATSPITSANQIKKMSHSYYSFHFLPT